MGFFRRKSPFQLTGLVASPDGLYDESFVAACAGWWNAEVERNKTMRLNGHRPFTEDEIHKLQAVVQPANRKVLEAVASSVAVPGRQSAAVLCLAYAFALVAGAGTAQVMRSREGGGRVDAATAVHRRGH